MGGVLRTSTDELMVMGHNVFQHRLHQLFTPQLFNHNDYYCALNKRHQLLMFVISILVALVCAFYYYMERVPYTVPSKGIVLITGASTGIGRHAAESIATEKPEILVLAGVRKQKDFEEIAAMNVGNLKPLLLDVSKHESCVAAADDIVEMVNGKGLPFVGLVNNAGRADGGLFETHDLDNARQVFDVNYFGVMDITQLLLPLLRESKGRIVQISSVAGFISSIGMTVYSGTKFALEAMSDALRRELRPLGVSVSVIEPGFIKTPIIDTAMKVKESFLEENLDRKAAIEAISANYPKQFLSNKSGIESMSSAPGPEQTTAVIMDALFSEYPRTRYWAGVLDAKGVPAIVARYLANILSDRMVDHMMIQDKYDNA